MILAIIITAVICTMFGFVLCAILTSGTMEDLRTAYQAAAKIADENSKRAEELIDKAGKNIKITDLILKQASELYKTDYLEKAINNIKSKHGIEQLHILKLNPEFVYPIITGKKEIEIRKMNKSFILSNQHVLFVDPDHGIPLLLVYVESGNIYELLESEKDEQNYAIQLILRMIKDGIKIDLKTRDFARQNYYDQTALIVFKIKFLHDFTETMK